MKLYEGLFLFTTTVGTDEQIKSIEAVLNKYEAKVLKKNDWNKRSLGYEVKKQREGHFFVFEFEAEPSKIDSLRRALELQEGLLKYMVTHKVVGAEVAPAADAKKASSSSEKTQTVTTK